MRRTTSDDEIGSLQPPLRRHSLASEEAQSNNESFLQINDEIDSDSTGFQLDEMRREDSLARAKINVRIPNSAFAEEMEQTRHVPEMSGENSLAHVEKNAPASNGAFAEELGETRLVRVNSLDDHKAMKNGAILENQELETNNSGDDVETSSVRDESTCPVPVPLTGNGNILCRPGAVAVQGPGRPNSHQSLVRNPSNSEEADGAIVSAELVDENALASEIHQRIINNAVQVDAVVPDNDEKPVHHTSSRKKKMLLLLGALLLVLGVLGAVLGTILPSRNQKQETPSAAPQLSDFELLREMLIPVSGDALLNESSPQFGALEWLAFEDTAMIPLNGTPRSVFVDRYVMVLFYVVTGGSDWLDSTNFLSNTSVCEWNGLECDTTGSVVIVNMYENNLNGTIPKELSALPSLEAISVPGNNLYGTIPSTIGELARLEFLQLSRNFLTGTIPRSLANISNLEMLNLQNNGLIGSIPERLTKIDSLEILKLQINQLTGTIPDFALHTRVREIHLHTNLLKGPIPQSITSLLALQYLDLSGNMVTGTIPSQLGKLEKLEYLFLWSNLLSGKIPTEAGLLGNLKSMAIDSNQLTGTVPTELGLMTSLERAWLSNNSFTGAVPSELGRLKLLGHFYLESNELTGVIPSTLTALTSLIRFSLGNTSINGTLDPIFCDRPEPAPLFFRADCGGTSPEVNCTCCTECCDDASGQCQTNLPAVCDGYLGFLEEEEKNRGPVCECIDEGFTISCNNTVCNRYCNEDDTACAVDVNYGLTFDTSGNLVSYYKNYQYVSGRDERVSYVRNYEEGRCQVSVDGKECNSCSFVNCEDGFEAAMIDCNNVEIGATFVGCVSTSGGEVLEVMGSGNWKCS